MPSRSLRNHVYICDLGYDPARWGELSLSAVAGEALGFWRPGHDRPPSPVADTDRSADRSSFCTPELSGLINWHLTCDVIKPEHVCAGLRIRRLGVRVPPSAPRLTCEHSARADHLTHPAPDTDRSADRSRAVMTISWPRRGRPCGDRSRARPWSRRPAGSSPRARARTSLWSTSGRGGGWRRSP